ncbi:hypothetical protein RRG08_066451 [Elysia crispata]|uniref:Uncharacterized protein n=1 Tax=Elysia crispata TaxID=231223 RepID=A0AAE0ZKL2_9GAST|nr:hypothetical protein RRG08_066451 [Elysia crispata]
MGAGLILYISVSADLILYNGCRFDTHLSGCGFDPLQWVQFDTLHLMSADLILYNGCGFDTLHLQWVQFDPAMGAVSAGLILYNSSGCGSLILFISSGCGFDTPVSAGLILYISVSAGLILYNSSECGFDPLHLYELGFDTTSPVSACLILYISVSPGLILYISMGAGLILYISSECGFDTLHLHGCWFDTLHLQWVLVWYSTTPVISALKTHLPVVARRREGEMKENPVSAGLIPYNPVSAGLRQELSEYGFDTAISRTSAHGLQLKGVKE